MDFLELAKKRFSVRAYEATPIPDETVSAVLEAARLAPSASNRQPYHLIVVREEPCRHALNTAYPREWFRKAPVVIIVCAEPAKAWVRCDGRNYADVDATIAMDYITLAAASQGLGTCWVAAFDPVKLRALLELPDGIEPLAMTPLGIPAEPLHIKTRKSLAELVHREHW